MKNEVDIASFIELVVRIVLIVTLTVLGLILIVDLTEARPIDIAQEDWAEMKRVDMQTRKQSEAPILPPLVEQLAPVEAEEYWCEGSTIGEVLFWVPDWCLERALSTNQFPLLPGQELYCMRGYLSSDDEIMVVPAFPGEEKVEGWPLCVDGVE